MILCKNKLLRYNYGKDQFFGAGNGIRTRDLCLGKATLYQLSYSRVLIPTKVPERISLSIKKVILEII